MRIVAALILKDEAPKLPQVYMTLAALRAAAVYIVDTGSTDGTPDRARALGRAHGIETHIVNDLWDDDFARSRNVGLDLLDHVEGLHRQDPQRTWVVWLDADDRAEGADQLLDALGRIEDDPSAVKLITVPVVSPRPEGVVEVVNQIRLWARSAHIRFQFPAHMQPMLDHLPEADRESGMVPGFRILHSGYVHGRNNAERTLRIVRAKMAEGHPHRLNCEVRALATLGHWDEATAVALRAIAPAAKGPPAPSTLPMGDATLWTIATLGLLRKADWPKALGVAAEGLTLYPVSPDLWMLALQAAAMGLVFAGYDVAVGHPTVSAVLPQIPGLVEALVGCGSLKLGTFAPEILEAIRTASAAPTVPEAASQPSAPEEAAPQPSAAKAPLGPAGAKPRVCIVIDAPNWAWARKAAHLERFLGDEFDIRVWSTVVDGDVKGEWDLVHCFEFPQVDLLPPKAHAVTGITAHVWKTWGIDRIRSWAQRAQALHANSVLLKNEMDWIFDPPTPPDKATKFPVHRKVYYVPNGVDPAQFRRTRLRGGDRRRLVVGHVGKPNPRKGFPFLEEVCRQAGVNLMPIRRTSKDALPAEAMREWYQDLDVLVVASDMDGTPNPALEAAACGVMVVSNRIGNMPEFIVNGANGFLVPDREGRRDEAAYIEKLRWCASHRDEVIAMGREAHRTVMEGWTWAHRAENYRTMWREVLGAQHGGEP